MGWVIENNRLAYREENSVIYPTVEEIYVLIQEGKEKLFAGLKSKIQDDLNIRFSKLGAKIQFFLDFNSVNNKIQIFLFGIWGNKRAQLNYKEKKLPDSVVINETWHNLLLNYEESYKSLLLAGINEDGEISLCQYILLKKELDSKSNIEVEDKAQIALSNHPMKSKTGELPVSLNASLYSYQQQGYQWMSFITGEKCGCVLGDEMGLGKTLQVIALIAERKEQGYNPSLIICPVSLLENWRREFNKFTIGLKILIHHGVRRTGLYRNLLEHDVVIISYNTASSDQSILKMVHWDLVVVDEAQNIKNPLANRTKCIKNIPRCVGIAVTGTPFENHMSDLWSLMDFVVPGGFGKLTEFETQYPDNVEGAKALEPILTPIMIRRRVAEVAKDLPERIDIPQILQMSSDEAAVYEKVREKILDNFNGTHANLSMLQKMRMYCTHPLLINDEIQSNPIMSCGKYERMCELLEEIIFLNEKVILFTSYNKMFDILQKDIPARFGIRVMLINGSTPVKKRQAIIDEFSEISETALLVLNPRAAGAGLNITAANRVIHYNLEWNPSLEDQASARSFRRGQTKPVFVYRMYYKNTVEEIMNERLEKKREMFGNVVVGTDGSMENSEDIIKALMISPGGN